jgi:hypothetical protein
MEKNVIRILCLVALILVGGPALAIEAPESFGAVLYLHGWSGVDDGINHASVLTGVRIGGGSGWRLYLGGEMTDFAPTYDAGALVKSNQGGGGPMLFYSMDMTWGPKLPSGKAALGVVAFGSYLSDMVQEPDGDMEWGGHGGIALRVSMSDEDALAAGFAWHSAYGGFIETTSIGGGVIVGRPIQKLASIPISVARGAVKAVRAVGHITDIFTNGEDGKDAAGS